MDVDFFWERKHALWALFGIALAVGATATAGGAFTAPQIPGWYHALARPSWTPPDWVFAPAWTTLYVIMALAAWAIWRRRDSPDRTRALNLWWAQLAFNFAWSPLFFALHLVGLAFADILVLLTLVVLTCVTFRRVIPLAGWAMLPYLVWLCYATSLNAAILYLNH